MTMRLSARTFAAMLIGLALAAAQPEANSQSRGNSKSSQSSSVSRSTNTTKRQQPQSANKPASRPATRPATKPETKPASRPASKPEAKPASKPEAKPAIRPETKPVTRPSSRPEAKPATKPATKPSPNQPTKPASRPETKPANRPAPKPNYNRPDRPDSRPRPPRVHPRDRDFMDYSRPKMHWSNHPHYYGYRIQTLPPRAIRHYYGGITYYVYDDIWYRPYNGYYIVSRPPFGLSLAANIINDIAWTAVQLSYYNTIANTYNTISENNAYIAQQNAVIAQNNATLAAQNQAIAQSQEKAQIAYGLANELGLIQSYASASTSYFYQDGVFYTQGSDGQYYVIVPPAGAIVDRLPEDFDTVILNGEKYYRVDDTIYQMVINEGRPYFEVLGQMN